MDNRLSIAGQAVQPILVLFPLGLFVMAVIFDVANLLGGPDVLGALAYWNVVAGLVSGALAAVAGVVELVLVTRSTVKRLGVLRTLLNLGVLVLFAVILLVRVGAPDRQAGVGLLFVELLAVALAGFGAWFSNQVAHGRIPAFARAAVEHRGY